MKPRAKRRTSTDDGQNVASSDASARSGLAAVFENFGDGRVGIAYDNVLDSSETSRLNFKIFDLLRCKCISK